MSRRNYDGDHPVREWVVSGEGITTLNIDGTCCLVHNNMLFKWHEEGWLLIYDRPEDQCYLEAFAMSKEWPDGIYTLACQQGRHTLIPW